jgi:hypothetical protein
MAAAKTAELARRCARKCLLRAGTLRGVEIFIALGQQVEAARKWKSSDGRQADAFRYNLSPELAFAR